MLNLLLIVCAAGLILYGYRIMSRIDRFDEAQEEERIREKERNRIKDVDADEKETTNAGEK
jgi:hypothetical protein